MEDHDQRFKVLLREFFAEFLRLFFPQWAERFDFTQVEWLDKEVFLDPPRGRRRALDLVAKLPTRRPITPDQRSPEEDTWLALVHIEVEATDSVEPLRSSVFDYYKQLRNRHDLPVLPIALYLRVGLDGVGWDEYDEYFWEHRLLHFEYAYVGLPALDGEEYATGANILGVALAALMRVSQERRIQLAAEILQRLARSGENEYRRFLLAECALAYLAPGEAQRQQLEQVLRNEPYKEAQTMTVGYFEQFVQKGRDEGLQKGRDEGLQKGRAEGQRKLLQVQLERKFGPLSPPIRERLASWSEDRLLQLAEALVQAQSLRELGLED